MGNLSQKLLIGLLGLSLLLFGTLPAAAAKKKGRSAPLKIKESRILESDNHIRIIFYLNKIPEYSHGFIPADADKNLPDRLYIDFRRLELTPANLPDKNLPEKVIKKLRYGQKSKDEVRLVFDLTGHYNYKISKLSKPTRLAIDLEVKPKAPPVAEASAESAAAILLPIPTEVPPPEEVKQHYIIVLDPGHGGDDTGAVGPTGLQEKNVALDLVLGLAEELKQDENITIYLTRDKDIELGLAERSALANTQKADLFISLHINASTERSLSGFATYYLNNTDDRFSQRLAAQENSASGEELTPLEHVLNDLKMNQITASSQKLAGLVQSKTMAVIGGEETGVKDQGVKTALFYVLLGARMPSILVECNFISNPHEETLLARPTYRQKLIKGIAAGIREYLAP